MYSYIEDRVLAVADYIIDHQATVRAAAGAFKISKSTVYMVVVNRTVFVVYHIVTLIASSLKSSMKKS